MVSKLSICVIWFHKWLFVSSMLGYTWMIWYMIWLCKWLFASSMLGYIRIWSVYRSPKFSYMWDLISSMIICFISVKVHTYMITFISQIYVCFVHMPLSGWVYTYIISLSYVCVLILDVICLIIVRVHTRMFD